MISADTLAHYRERLERIRLRTDVEDVPWLVTRVGELLDEVDRLRPEQASFPSLFELLEAEREPVA